MCKVKFRVALLKSGEWEVEQVEDWGRASITNVLEKYSFVNNSLSENAEDALRAAKRAHAMVSTVSQRSRNKEKLNG